MDKNRFVVESVIRDASGQEWLARVARGVAIEGPGEALGTDVEFTHTVTGQRLRSRVLGIDGASDEELAGILGDAIERSRRVP